MSELYPGDNYPRLFARSKHVIAEPALYHGGGMVFRHLGSAMNGERIIMPLAAKGPVAGGILGATAYPQKRQENLGADFDGEIETWFGL